MNQESHSILYGIQIQRKKLYHEDKLELINSYTFESYIIKVFQAYTYFYSQLQILGRNYSSFRLQFFCLFHVYSMFILVLALHVLSYIIQFACMNKLPVSLNLYQTLSHLNSMYLQ